MEIFNQFKSDTLETINSLFYKIGEGIISFLYAILVLVIGWLITKLIVFILEKALRVSKIESLSDKLRRIGLFTPESKISESCTPFTSIGIIIRLFTN